MGKRAFVFPGQGAQYIGMAKEFYDQMPESRGIFALASEASGLDIAALCFEENDKINITEYTQICMLTAEAAILKALEKEGIRPDVTAGLSLGEYGALLVAGVFDWRDAFSLVRKRGIYMQEAVPAGGAMAAVMGLHAPVIEDICRKSEGIVAVANYNCPGQIVISGEEAAIKAAGAACLESGAKRVIPLKVSGPFHSPMLSGAGEKLGSELEAVAVHPVQIPYVANVLADYVSDATMVRDLLRLQVSQFLHIPGRYPRFICIMVKIKLLPVFLRVKEQVIQVIPGQQKHPDLGRRGRQGHHGSNSRFLFSHGQNPVIAVQHFHPQPQVPAVLFKRLPDKMIQIRGLHTQVHPVKLNDCRIARPHQKMMLV